MFLLSGFFEEQPGVDGDSSYSGGDVPDASSMVLGARPGTASGSLVLVLLCLRYTVAC